MSDSAEPLRVARSTRVANLSLRQRTVAVLDNLVFKAAFGVALPLLIVLFLWVVPYRLGKASIERRLRFDFTDHPMLSLVAVEAVLFLIWAFMQPRGRLVSRAAFVLLSVGTTLAGAWAILIAIFMVRSMGRESSSMTIVLLGAILASIPSLTCAVFFRQACLAWTKSAFASRASPARAVLTMAVGISALCGGATLLGIQAGHYAMEQLRSDRADAVDSALAPMRMAAILRGEDRLLPLYEQEPDDAVQERFDLAFQRLTGKSVEARQLELHPEHD